MFGRRKDRGESVSSGSDEPASVMEEGRGGGSHTKNKKKKTKKRTRKVKDIPVRSVLHKMFIIIAVLTALCALWMLIGQILGIIIYENTMVSYTLRGYVSLMCVLAIFVEMEWPGPVRESTLANYWTARGLLYGFIGVVGMQENDSSEIVIEKEDWESYEMIADIVVAVSWNMIAAGVLYFVMGLFCLRTLLVRMRTNYQERVEIARNRLGGDDNDSDSSGEDNHEEAIEVAFADVNHNKLLDEKKKSPSSEDQKKTLSDEEEESQNETNEDAESVSDKSSTGDSDTESVTELPTKDTSDDRSQSSSEEVEDEQKEHKDEKSK